MASPLPQGIQLRWALGSAVSASAVTIERAPSSAGPWTTMNLTPQRDGSQFVAVDASAAAGQTYWYRLQTTGTDGSTLTLGQISGTAGQPITQFALTRIAPNPSRDVVQVEFTVPRTASVKVAVLDVAGREVATLASGDHAPGRYQVFWSGDVNGHQAPSGLYFIRMQAPGVQTTHRVAIAR